MEKDQNGVNPLTILSRGVRYSFLEGTLSKAAYQTGATYKNHYTWFCLLKVIDRTDFDAVCCV